MKNKKGFIVVLGQTIAYRSIDLITENIDLTVVAINLSTIATTIFL